MAEEYLTISAKDELVWLLQEGEVEQARQFYEQQRGVLRGELTIADYHSALEKASKPGVGDELFVLLVQDALFSNSQIRTPAQLNAVA